MFYKKNSLSEINQHFSLVQDIPLCLQYINNGKINMYSVWHNYLLISLLLLLLFYYCLLVSASKSHQQANIYKKNMCISILIFL